MPICKLDQIDRLLLDRIQKSFPLVSNPFDTLGKSLKISEEEVLARIQSLKQRNILRQISAIFNTGALGYKSSLVAMAVPENDMEKAVAVINAYPGVSHNYLRPAKFNIWFTLAVPPYRDLELVVQSLARDAGDRDFLILPALRRYKLAVVLDVLEDSDYELAKDERFPTPSGALQDWLSFDLTATTIKIVKCVQDDIPTVKRPFEYWARSIGLREETLLNTLREWSLQGLIRRFAAVLNHRQAGFLANGMILWQCPPAKLDEAGSRLASFPEVSHCYHRPAYPEWPYNLYAMVHGKTDMECNLVAEKLSKEIEILEYKVLFSIKEFKKVRLKLFWDEGGVL